MNQLEKDIAQVKKDVIEHDSSQYPGKPDGVDLKSNLQQIEKMVLQQVKSGGIDQEELLVQKQILPIHYAHQVFLGLLRLQMGQNGVRPTSSKESSSEMPGLEQMKTVQDLREFAERRIKQDADVRETSRKTIEQMIHQWSAAIQQSATTSHGQGVNVKLWYK